MSFATASLPRTLQLLVDARLDTIDRMLIGWTPRQERLSIVREVESQVLELLHERDVEALTREDVLSVLARLDPPEAYLPSEEEDPDTGRVAARTPIPARSSISRSARYARTSGIVGLAAVALVLLSPLVFILAELSNSEPIAFLLLGGDIVVTMVTSFAAIVIGIVGRRGGGWSAVGLIAGGFGVFCSLLAGGYLTLLFLNQ